ncbi:MAG: hypothetical protein WC901_08310 [Candidatus Margulisiibacteriota bacterium]
MKKLILAGMFLFMFASLVLAYPSSSKVISDVKGDYKGEAIAVKVTGTAWETSWSESVSQLQPPDEARIWVVVTHPKAKDGSYVVSEGSAVYYRPAGSSKDNWSFREFYLHKTEVKGAAAISPEQLLAIGITCLKSSPMALNSAAYNIKKIYSVKLAEPSGYKRISADQMEFNLTVVYARGSSGDLIKEERKVNVMAVKQNGVWGNKYCIPSGNPNEISRQIMGRAAVEAMPNLEDNGFDAIYGAEGTSSSPQLPDAAGIQKALVATLISNEKSFEDILKVPASQVFYEKESLVCKKEGIAVLKAQNNEDGSISVPVQIRYKFYDPTQFEREIPVVYYRMVYYVTQTYNLVVKPAASQGYTIVSSERVGEPLEGFKSPAPAKIVTFHDAFVKAGKAN